MPTIEQGQTTDATPSRCILVTLGAEAGMIQKYIHWSAYTSKDVCAAGEALLVWSKMPVPRLWSNSVRARR